MRRHTILGAGLMAGFVLAPAAFGKTCQETIGGDDQMHYVNPDKPTEQVKRIEVAPDCTEVKVTLKHVGKLPKEAMGHNFILTSATWQELQPEAQKAGLQADYVPKDKRVIAATKLVGGGQSTDVTFKTAGLQKGKEYEFFCGFPAHAAAGMNGIFVVKAGGKAAH